MTDGYQLTEKQVKYFIAEVQKWCRFFSIADYEVKIDDGGDCDNYADCTANVSNRYAIISVTKEWPNEPTNKQISRTAFHEVCELLLMELGTLAETRFVSETSLEIARHRIIRTLENVVWKPKAAKFS
jgi:hypothetical protein